MEAVPLPSAAPDPQSLHERLDAASHEARVAWCRSLGRAEQYKLFELCAGRPVRVADLARGDREVVIHYGKNGLLAFNLFQKRFTRLGDRVVGYNYAEVASLIRPIYSFVTGPGHYTAYDAPDGRPEVWIDYRMLPTEQHPDFPPLVDNESGLRALVFGNLVDVLRRVSTHVFIGDSYKDKERTDTPPAIVRFASRFLPTAPFVLCQAP